MRAHALPEERRQYWPHLSSVSALPYPLPLGSLASYCGICGQVFHSDAALRAHRDLGKSTMTKCVPLPSRWSTKKEAR